MTLTPVSSDNWRIRLKISVDCTGEPPGELIENATADRPGMRNAASSVSSTPCMDSDGLNGRSMPMAPFSRTWVTNLRLPRSSLVNQPGGGFFPFFLRDLGLSIQCSGNVEDGRWALRRTWLHKAGDASLTRKREDVRGARLHQSRAESHFLRRHAERDRSSASTVPSSPSCRVR
jgi:hypothetical protein